MTAIQGKGPSGVPMPMPVPVQRKTAQPPARIGTSTVPGKQFGDLLQQELERAGGLKISAHAERRLRERNIVLDSNDMAKIEGAVQKAAAKGSRESLVIYGDIALVASVKNRTLITAVDGEALREHVFTNIDSAVIIK